MSSYSKGASSKSSMSDKHLSNAQCGKKGITNAIHGWSYQLKILMLIYIRAQSIPKYNKFKIHTENTEFGKFDDATFEYEENGQTWYRSVQVKHVKSETKTVIAKDDLIGDIFKDDKSKFRLAKYLRSFIKMKNSTTGTDNRDFIIFTNACLEKKAEKLFTKITTVDDMFDVSASDNIKVVLPKGVNNVNNKNTPQKYKLAFNKTDALYKLFVDICTRECSTKSAEALIDEFCEQFIFATGQPNDDEMDAILSNGFYKISGLPISDFVDSNLMKIFLVWLKNKYENDLPLTNEDLAVIVPLIQVKAKNFVANMHYQTDLKLKEIKYIEEDPTIIRVKNYVNPENHNKEHFLLIPTKYPVLTLAKIFQCLEYKTENNSSECLLIEVKKKEAQDFHQQLKHMEYFHFCVISFDEKIGVDYQKDVLRMLEKNRSKLLILTSFVIDAEKFDNVNFKGLDSSTQKNIFNRFVDFDGEQIALKDIASIEDFEDINDCAWLSKLVTNDFSILNKVKLSSSEDHYIERYFKAKKGKYTVFAEDDVINLNKNLIILSAEPGMGKSYVLPSLCRKIKTQKSSKWIEIVKLTQHLKVLHEFKEDDDSIDFLATKVLNYNELTVKLFKINLNIENKTVIMFDAFDEVSPEDREKVVRIIKELLKTSIQQVWIATRPFVVNVLEDQFSDRSVYLKLRKFSDSNIITFLQHTLNNQHNTYSPDEIKNFASDLLRSFAYHHNIYFELHIPLYTQMAGEYLISTNFKLPENFSKKSLYEKFIENKYKIYTEEKNGCNLDNHRVKEEHIRKTKEYDDFHQQLALKLLYPANIKKYTISKDDIPIINAIGIATVDEKDETIISFSHKTFAEFFLSKLLFSKFTTWNINDIELLNLMWQQIFVVNNQEIGYFLNIFLDKTPLPTKFYFDFSHVLFVTITPQQIGTYFITDNVNLIIVLYKSICFENSKECLQKFKECLPNLLHRKMLNFKDGDQTFLQMLFDENADFMDYKLDELIYVIKLLEIDDVTLLEKYLNALEKQLTSNESIKNFLTSYYFDESSSMVQYCYLAYLRKNCFDFMLNYLIKKITPIRDFHLFLLRTDLAYKLMNELLSWSQQNLEKGFYDLLVDIWTPSEPIVDDEQKYIYSYIHLMNSKSVDHFKYTIDTILLSIYHDFEKLKDVINAHLEKVSLSMEFEKNIQYVNEKVRMHSLDRHFNHVLLCEFYRFVLILFSDQKEDFMKQLTSPLNLLNFDEFEVLLTGNWTKSLLTYLRDTLGIEVLKQLITLRNFENDLFFNNHNKTVLKWIRSNTDEQFFKLCCILSTSSETTKENKFIHFYKSCIELNSLDILFSHEALLEAIPNCYSLAVDVILEYLKCFKKEQHSIIAKEILEMATKTGNTDILKKLLKYFVNVFRHKSDAFIKSIIPSNFKINFKLVDLEMLLSENVKGFGPSLKAVIRNMGMLVTEVALARYNAENIENIFEYKTFSKEDDNQKLKEITDLLDIKSMKNVLFINNTDRDINYVFTGSALRIMESYYPHPIPNYLYSHPIIMDLFYELFKKMLCN